MDKYLKSLDEESVDSDARKSRSSLGFTKARCVSCLKSYYD